LLNQLEFKLMNNPIRGFVQRHYEIKTFLDNEKLEGKRVLEIGCGNGYGSYLINKYFQPNEIIGIDLDPKFISLAKKNYPQFNFQVGDAAKLNFPNNHFDAIFDFDAMCHIPNWQDALKEIYRVLKNKGRVFIEDFSVESYDTLAGRLTRLFTVHPYDQMFHRSEFFNFFDKLGFKVIKKEIRNPLGLMEYFVLIASK